MRISHDELARWRGLAIDFLARVGPDVALPVPKDDRERLGCPVELQGCTRDELEALAHPDGVQSLPMDLEVE